jgi:osmotically-inducible protein OsmY
VDRRRRRVVGAAFSRRRLSRHTCGLSRTAPSNASTEISAQIPADYIDVEVKDGWVILKGDVDFQYQSDSAFDHVASMYGVTGVTNDIKVVEPL